MNKRGPGRPTLAAEKRRSVKLAIYLTPEEAARLDAVRGGVERSVMVREATIALVKRLEASERAKAARAALVMP